MADDNAPVTGQQVATRPHYAAVGMSAFGSGALPALTSVADVVSIAQLMAKAGVAVRAHLRDNPGACLAVTMQALRWNADPFAIANKTFAVNDQLAYESQVIAAVINTMAPIRGRPEYTYEGEGQDRTVTVSVTTTEGQRLALTTPTFAKITPKNSPLWKSDPDQQQGYYAIRALGRRHFPEIILGIYDPDEMERREAPHVGHEALPSLTAGLGEGPKSRARKPKEVEPPQDTGESSEGRPEQSEAAGAGVSVEAEVQDAEFEDAGTQEDKPATSEAAPPASESEKPADDDVKAPRDQVYRLSSDVEVGEDGRLPTYMNGQPYSRVKATAKAQPPVYDLHADAEETAEAVGEDPPAQDETNTLAEAFERIKAAESYLGAKQMLKTAAGTPAFKDAPAPMKAKLREALWDRYGELKDEGRETVEIHEDLALMQGFLEFGATSVGEIDAVWPVFWKRGAYGRANAADKEAITELLLRRKDELKGGA